MIKQAAKIIKDSRWVSAFTGAGISTESGLPEFKDWPGFNPVILDADYFAAFPKESWALFKTFFYDWYGKAVPNPAHGALAAMEEKQLIKATITLNIDGLQQKAGSKKVIEAHGSLQNLICLQCKQIVSATAEVLHSLPVQCPSCGGLLRPDILFYGDMMPVERNKSALREANRAKVLLLIGVSGQTVPTGLIPMFAKRHSQTIIIEINTQRTRYTEGTTDVFIQAKAADALPDLLKELEK